MHYRVLASLSRVCVVGALALFSAAGAAQAGTVNLTDNYNGGYDTYSGQSLGTTLTQGGVSANLYSADIIGDASIFNIFGASVTRTNGGNTLVVTINTDYAGVPGTPGADGTGYGALFISPGTWTPSGTAANNYATDTYATGEKWQYAVAMPMTPGTASGSTDLYATSNGTVQLSNVYGNPNTYPFPNNPGYYFREGQAVQFMPTDPTNTVAPATWALGTDTLTFTINDNHSLGDYFAIAWAMTCGNDVFQAQVSGVPEPATWTTMLLGFGVLGFAMRRRRRTTSVADAQVAA